MRLLFSIRPAYGHLYPVMPLAMAARDAGHQVSFATTGTFLSKLELLGFPTHDVGLTFEQAMGLMTSSPGAGIPRGADGRPELDFAGRLFFDVLPRRAAADLAPLVAELAPDVVVYEQAEMGSAIVAHAAGIPAICHSISPRMPDEVLAVMDGGRVDRLWAEYGKPRSSFDVSTGDCFLDIFPTVLQQSSFLTDPARVRMRPIPYAEPSATVPGWVAAKDRPLVYLTLGTVSATDEGLLPAIEGLATLDADILLALGSAGGTELGAMPENVHVEQFVNQASLLPSVDLIVHHGGSGTVLAALAHGTPQIVLPKGADQFFNADRLARAGLASVLEPQQVTPDSVAARAKEALEGNCSAVDRVRDEIASLPHPSDVLEQVLANLVTARDPLTSAHR